MDTYFGIVVCCRIEVSVSGWSLFQRSSTACDVSECDREASTMRRPWPLAGAVAPWIKKVKRHKLKQRNRPTWQTNFIRKSPFSLRSSKQILCWFFRIFRHLNSRTFSLYQSLVRKNTLAQRLVQQSLWSTANETVLYK